MDQIVNFNNTSSELEKMIRDKKLDEETKKIVETAMEFGYSAAYCARTSDIHGSIHASIRYTDTYKAMKKLLEEK